MQTKPFRIILHLPRDAPLMLSPQCHNPQYSLPPSTLNPNLMRQPQTSHFEFLRRGGSWAQDVNIYLQIYMYSICIKNARLAQPENVTVFFPFNLQRANNNNKHKNNNSKSNTPTTGKNLSATRQTPPFFVPLSTATATAAVAEKGFPFLKAPCSMYKMAACIT